MKVGIIYGWSEGPWQGRQLRALLHAEGYQVTKKLADADILIAHSGGCYLLPEKSKANLVLLIGLPYHPGAHPLKSLREKMRHEAKDWWWIKKLFSIRIIYSPVPGDGLGCGGAGKKLSLPSYENIEVIAVRNKHDHFMHPIETQELVDSKGWTLQTLGGHHDDIWINPRPYVDMLKRALHD